MTRTLTRCLAAAVVALGCGAETDTSTPDAAVDETPRVALETTLGTITLELDRARAPETVKHFVTHVRSGFYDGVVVHRIEPGFVIQIGGWQPDGRERKTSAFPVPNENPNGLANVRGTLAMARTSDPHSGLVDFFINLVDNRSKLDFRDSSVTGFGYVVFGNVVAGMDIVDMIARIPTEAKSRQLRSYPLTPPVIERARLIEQATP